MDHLTRFEIWKLHATGKLIWKIKICNLKTRDIQNQKYINCKLQRLQRRKVGCDLVGRSNGTIGKKCVNWTLNIEPILLLFYCVIRIILLSLFIIKDLKHLFSMFRFDPLEAVNYYHKALHLGCCSSPRSTPAEARSGIHAEDKFLIALPGKHKIIKFVSEILSTMICFYLKT